jgi:aspartate-semialdehyde dehydrogenase
MKKYNIAILGATGLVGQTFIKILEEYDIPINELRLFASKKSLGKIIVFKDKEFEVKVIENGSFKGIDFALFSAGANASFMYAKQAIEEGAIVIDNSSAFRMDKDVPLVVPEINLKDAIGKKLIANPNCSTIQSVLPLYALDKAYKVLQVEYNTYQSVSGSGYKGIKDLETGVNNLYPYNIKETCIPQIDVFLDDGYTKEEHKMMDETRKILHKDDLQISATCVRVPVKYCHAVNIRVKLEEHVSVTRIRETLSEQAGIILIDNPCDELYPTSIIAKDTDEVFVGRVRRDKIDKSVVLLYCVADNIRKGAASNAIQIMRGLMEFD